MSLVCAISGQTPTEPVISRSTGHVFEKSLILQHIEATGKHPINGEPMSESDIIHIQVGKSIAPRPATAVSIPTMLQLFQNEWDSVMLESFNLRKQLEATKQELSHALYQHDAACRVIARLIRERDEARASLTHAREVLKNSNAMEVDATPSVPQISEENISRIEETANSLRQSRKKRVIAPTLASKEKVENFKQINSFSGLHSSIHQGLTCLDIHSDQNRIITGGVDKNAVLFDRQKGQILSSHSHPRRVSSVKFHPTMDVFFTACDDGIVRIFSRDSSDYVAMQTKFVHDAELTGLDLHPVGNLLFASSRDNSWSFHDLTSESSFNVRSENSLECLQIHPDGLIFATGSSDKTVRVWDIKTQKVAATLSEGHSAAITSLCFSENGYYLATAAADAVQLWDLRKPKNFLTLPAQSGGSITSVQFDHSGNYFAVAGSEIRIFNSKSKFELVKTFTDNEGLVTGVKFGNDATWLASSSMDRTLRIFG